MPRSIAAPSTSAAHPAIERCLLAPNQLNSLLQWLDELPPCPGHPYDRSAFAQAWRQARRVYQSLEQQEAGAADAPEVRPLPASLQAHVSQLLANPSIQATFDTVPVALGLVPLDQLVVSQYTLTQTIVDSLQAAPGPARTRKPSPRELASLCLPLKARPTEFVVAQQEERQFTFVSSAHDMRHLGTQVLGPTQLQALAVHGHPQATLGVHLGFSTNVLNVVRWGSRLVLNNGHHRAHALRQRGVQWVPCVIQVCESFDDVRQAATAEIVRHSELYFESPRPPLLRDFDDPRLTRDVHTPRLRRQVRVRIEVESDLVAL